MRYRYVHIVCGVGEVRLWEYSSGSKEEVAEVEEISRPKASLSIPRLYSRGSERGAV